MGSGAALTASGAAPLAFSSPSTRAPRGGFARPRGKCPSFGWSSSSRRESQTPRAVMQACVASMTTATPLGWRCSQIASATCAVSRSCTCSRREKPWRTRASLLIPTTLLLRQIGDRRLADDRRHVVLAMRLERYVLQKDDLVIAADLFEGPAEMERRDPPRTPRIFASRRARPGAACRAALRGRDRLPPSGSASGPPRRRRRELRTAGARLDEVAVFRIAMFVRRLMPSAPARYRRRSPPPVREYREPQ